MIKNLKCKEKQENIDKIYKIIIISIWRTGVKKMTSLNQNLFLDNSEEEVAVPVNCCLNARICEQ